MGFRATYDPVRRVLAATLICVAAFVQATAIAAAAPPALGYDTDTGTLSGGAEAGTDMADVLRAIAEAARVDLKISADLSPLGHAVTLDGLGIEAALRHLMAAQSTVLFYDEVADGPPRLRKIWVVASASAGPATSGTVVQMAPGDDAPAPAADSEQVIVTRAVALRDVVKLSYAADDGSARLLKQIASSAEDAAVRAAAISALAGIDAPERFGFFVGQGLRDRDAAVRIEAARSLTRIDPINSQSVLETAIGREPDPAARDIMRRLADGENVPFTSAKPSGHLLH